MVSRKLFLISLTLLLAGCFFETRESPPPELGGGCDFEYEFNDTWERVLYNIEGALGCQDAAEYMRMFSQTFLFEPSLTTAATYQQVFADTWATSRENLFINDVLGEEIYQADLGWEDPTDVVEQGNLITVTTQYLIQRVDENNDPIGAPYEDQVVFVFERAGQVLLAGWRDTDGLPTSLPFGNRRGDHRGGV